MGTQGSKQQTAEITPVPKEQKESKSLVKRIFSRKGRSAKSNPTLEEGSIREKREDTPCAEAAPSSNEGGAGDQKDEVSTPAAQAEATTEVKAEVTAPKEEPDATETRPKEEESSASAAPTSEEPKKEEKENPQAAPTPEAPVAAEVSKTEETIMETTKQESVTVVKEETKVTTTTVSKEETVMVETKTKEEIIEVKDDVIIEVPPPVKEEEVVMVSELKVESTIVEVPVEEVKAADPVEESVQDVKEEEKVIAQPPAAPEQPEVTSTTVVQQQEEIVEVKKEEIKTIIEVREDNVTIVEVNAPPPAVSVDEVPSTNGMSSMSEEETTTTPEEPKEQISVPIKVIEATPSPEEPKPLAEEAELNHVNEQNGEVHVVVHQNGVTEADEEKVTSSPKKKPLVSVTFGWSTGGKQVAVSGSFNDWAEPLDLAEKEEGQFSLTSALGEGLHHYKYRVDGEWTVNQDMPTAELEDRGLVNVLEVIPQQQD